MKIKFCGAAQTVTGSKHLVTTESSFKILLDCGLFQGIGTTELNQTFAFEPKELDAVILSHAHIDHTGLLPRLIKLGFSGPIYATPATKDLCEIMLMDSANIQKKDLERVNKRRKNQELEPLGVLYDEKDVKQTINQFITVPYRTMFEINKEISFTFYDSAHILGSAGIMIEVQEKKGLKKLYFTGDIGRPNDKILNYPDKFPQADVIIMESTYGNKLHQTESDMKAGLTKIVKETCVDKKGKLLIPAFSIDRTQEVIYALDQLSSEGKLPEIKVFVDSKLSVAATKIMSNHENCFNPEIIAYIKRDGNAFDFKNLKYITEIEDSKAIDFSDEPCIIISSSGMAEAGRIKHHIKNNIDDERCTVLLVGYCSPNSLGGALKRGDKEVRIFGETFQVKLGVEVMDSFSAHADYIEMIDYLKCQDPSRVQKLCLVHGELESQEAFKMRLENEGYKNVLIPAMKGEIEF